MKVQPNKSKYAKFRKGKSIMRIQSKNLYNNASSGLICVKTLLSYRLTDKHLQTFYFILNKLLKKIGCLHTKVFPSIPVSKKPNEIRMGKGKGPVDHWNIPVLAGSIICEIETNNIKSCLKIINYIKYKLPIKIKSIIL